jgi:hypothetical protein
VLARGQKGVRREAESEGSLRQNVAPANCAEVRYLHGWSLCICVISVEVRVHTPGRSAMLRESATATERLREGIAEVSRGHSKAWRQAEGPKVK